MLRPCFLVIDREHAGSISTRKLVIETAKLNVITAYSGAEALETLGRFPAVDGVVLDAGMPDMRCADLIRSLKQMQPATPVVLIATPLLSFCEGADHVLESFDPARLLALLTRLTPQSTQLREHEEALAREEQGSSVAAR